MFKKMENLCSLGSLTFDVSGLYISLVFEPHKDKLSSAMQSTVMIKRESVQEAVCALQYYINNGKHWSEYPYEFFTSDNSYLLR